MSILVLRSWGPTLMVIAIGVLGALISPQAAYAAVIANPSGVLLARGDVAFPANPIASNQYFSNSDVTGTDSEVLLGTTHYYKALNNDANCRLAWEYDDEDGLSEGVIADSAELHPYTTDEIEILQTGTYTFRVVASPGVTDPFMAMYAGGFSSATPDSNLVGCNDDSGNSDGDTFSENGLDNYPYASYDEYWSEFSVEITSVGTYTLMMSAYSFYLNDTDWYAGATPPGYEGATGDYYAADSNGDSGSGSIASATYEYWGPSGGINGTVNCVGCATGASDSPKSSSAPGIMLDVQQIMGRRPSEATVIIGGTGLKSNTPYALTLSGQNSPVYSGNSADAGTFWQEVRLPRGLAAGTFTLTLTATAADGSPLTLIRTLTIDRNGVITETSDSLGQLARTGSPVEAINLGIAGAGALMFGGVVALMAARRGRGLAKG